MRYVKKNSVEEYNSIFASRLRYLMEHADVNQQKLADFIGVTRQAVSAYTLGASLPDIEKFEKIADFFGVSTEYLLGRTEVMETNIVKQAISEALQLSEDSIDLIIGLQKEFRLEQNLENDWKLTVKEKEPLSAIFDRWLRFVDLEEFMSNLFKTIEAAANAQHSGYFPERYMLDEDDKNAVYNLKQRGYVTLTPTEQMDLYEQKAAKIFVQSVERLQSESIEATITLCEAEKTEQDQPEEDGGDGAQ
ncbi:MAG: helix-turn-helix domain-containing protein [Oscillospiraceae bacterium]|jgi:transcriptional regulator with XRE-family HTH domain|nr:helix-turn-helix domain-containing protein [Oscillospiraceae bacterium]